MSVSFGEWGNVNHGQKKNMAAVVPASFRQTRDDGQSSPKENCTHDVALAGCWGSC